MSPILIDHVVYINLERRHDRREHMERILTEYGITADRFVAIEHPHGLYGCGLSHLAVLKMARNNGWRNVLILEDDIEFTISKSEWEKQIQLLFTCIHDNFDVFMFDVNLQASEPTVFDHILRVQYAHCAGAYLVSGHYYQKLIDLYEWALPLLDQTHMHWVYANDAVWGGLQQEDRWYTFRNQVVRQMDGYSDTKNMMVVSNR